MAGTKFLEGKREYHNREALRIRAAMGTRPSRAQQAAFDSHMDEVGRIDAALDIRSAVGETFEQASDRQLAEFDNMLRTGVRATTSATVPSQGGYTVAPLVVSKIIDSLKGYGFMRQVSTEITTTTGAAGTVPTSDGTSEVGERLAEGAAAASMDPIFGQAPVNTAKYGSRIITVPIELLTDSAADIDTFVTQRARDRIGRVQNADFTVGTGVSQPTGLFTAATVGKTGMTGQTVSIIYDDLVDMVDSVDVANLGQPSKQAGVPGLPGVGWMMSQTTRKVVRKIKDANGMPVWMPGLNGDLPQLLDHAVHINNDAPAPGPGARSLAFGNLSRYVIRDVREVVMCRFADSVFSRMGQVGFLMIARAGGNLTDVNAVKVFQHPAS